MSFFKSVLSTLTGLIIFSLVVFFFIPMLLGIVVATGVDTIPTIDQPSVLSIRLHGTVAERLPEDLMGLNELLQELESTPVDVPRLGLLKTLEAIKAAKTDDNIKGIRLTHGYIVAGYAALEELRLALEDFKSSGKFIYSYGEYLSEANYYVASVADDIVLNPLGDIEFNGLNVKVMFFKGLLDKLGVEAQVFRVGDYKSAVEPFVRENMSEANREQLTFLIDDIYKHYLQNVSAARNIPVAELKEISDNMLVRKAEDAVTYGLATQVAYESEVEDAIRAKMGVEGTEKIPFVSLTKYIKTVEPDYSSNKIAVVVADGEIVSGKGETENVGAKRFAKAIKTARESSRVKAVVIRINSPGGSMMASDVLWHEIMLTKKEKPVYASMSSVAASGGYYLAMPCDTIVAQPNTITGSIGIFGIIPNFGGLLKNKLGIQVDDVSTGEFSNLYRVSGPLNDREKNIIQKAVDRGYDTFTEKAAEGRQMPLDALKKVASGRVWTGSQAQERKLVDVLGTYDDALHLAAKAAGIAEDYEVAYYPKFKSPFEEIFSALLNETESHLLSRQYGQMADYLKQIKQLEARQGVLARLPLDLTIQ